MIEVIDALSIGGEFIGNRPFPRRSIHVISFTYLFLSFHVFLFVHHRQELICKLCKAVNKPGIAQLR